MTQKEYEQKKRECWEEFLQKHEISTADGVTADAFIMAFDRAYALGKQEKDMGDTVIQGWVCRDTDDLLRLHYSKPERTDDGYWQGGYKSTYFPKGLFPDITWESDPEPVEIIIKRKKSIKM